MTAQSNPTKPRLSDQVRNAIRVRHMARSTEKAYVDWIRQGEEPLRIANERLKNYFSR